MFELGTYSVSAMKSHTVNNVHLNTAFMNNVSVKNAHISIHIINKVNFLLFRFAFIIHAI